MPEGQNNLWHLYLTQELRLLQCINRLVWSYGDQRYFQAAYQKEGLVDYFYMHCAAYLDLREDYRSDSILHTMHRFVSMQGCHGKIQSAQGSELIRAATDIAQIVGK